MRFAEKIFIVSKINKMHCEFNTEMITLFSSRFLVRSSVSVQVPRKLTQRGKEMVAVALKVDI